MPDADGDVAWTNDTIVYVDPESREVLGPLQWSRSERPKSLPVKESPARGRDRRMYPYGTYRAMRSAFRIGGKVPEPPRGTLEEILPRILRDLWI